jgi:hypothetical protein
MLNLGTCCSRRVIKSQFATPRRWSGPENSAGERTVAGTGTSGRKCLVHWHLEGERMRTAACEIYCRCVNVLKRP